MFMFADEDRLAKLKKDLCDIHGNGNGLKVWRTMLDKRGSMKISWEEWTLICNELRKSGPALQLTQDQVGSIWRAMDDDCSGYISVREWDEQAYDALSSFKRWADDTHGGVMKAFRALDG